MKKICFLFLLSVGLVLSSCKNYDGQFDALNGQITALQGQVTGLSALQTEITSLKSTITAIQSSLSGLQGTVAGVQSGFTTALQTAQSEITNQVKEQLDTGLGVLTTSLTGISEKNEALSASLTTLDTKLTQLEDKIRSIQDGAVSKEEVNEVQTKLAEQLTALEESLKEALKESNFHTGDLDLTSVGGLTFATTQLQDKTQINGDVTIDTSGWTDEQKTSLQEWVAKVTLIFGDLDITHADGEINNDDELVKAINFAVLKSVNTLIDKQPHAHYPELTSAKEVTFATGDADKVETVSLPGLETTVFTDHTIHLKKGKELYLDKFTHHEGNLSITLNGTGKTTLGALKELKEGKDAKQTLTLIGFSAVDLPALTTLKKLHVQDVNSLIAPNLQGQEVTELVISADVSSVDVGTGIANGGIKTLTFGAGEGAEKERDEAEAKRDLEVLKIAGSATLDVVIPSGVEVAHIHGAKSVTTEGSDDLDEFVTAREIKELTLTGTDVETESLTLGHTSGSAGKLEIVNNESLENLTADRVNNLNILKIQGNTRLEKISFDELITAAGTNAKIHIGGVGNKNRLIATSITLATKDDPKKGKIVDASGLSDLNTFLKSSISVAEVYYDGATQFKKSGDIEDTDPSISIDSDTIEDLVLFRKGVEGGKTTAKKAKRIFYYHPNRTQQNNLTIGAAGAFTTVELALGGSVANWAAEINKSAKSFFETNGVDIHAKPGGWNPTGSIVFDATTPPSTTPITNDSIDKHIPTDKNAYVKIQIGPDAKKNVYSHTVYISDNGDEDVPVETSGHITENKKEAISHLFLKTGNDDASTTPPGAQIDADEIIDKLISKFPGRVVEIATGASRENVPLRTIPYYLRDISATGVIIVNTYDKKRVDKTIPVTFDSNLEIDNLQGLGFLPDGAEVEENDIDNAFKDNAVITLTFTSNVAGKEASTIGQPQNARKYADGTDRVANDSSVPSATGFVEETVLGTFPFPATTKRVYITSNPNAIRAELPVRDDIKDRPTPDPNPDYPYWSVSGESGSPQLGEEEVGVTGGTENKDRLGWLT